MFSVCVCREGDRSSATGTWDEGGGHVLNKILPFVERDRWNGILATTNAIRAAVRACDATAPAPRSMMAFEGAQPFNDAACWNDPATLYSVIAPPAVGTPFTTRGIGPHMWRLNSLHQSATSGVLRFSHESSQPHDYLHLISMDILERERKFCTLFPAEIDLAQELLDVLQLARDRATQLQNGHPKRVGEGVRANGRNTIVAVPINGRTVYVDVTYDRAAPDERNDIAAYPISRYNTVFPAGGPLNFPPAYAPHAPGSTLAQVDAQLHTANDFLANLQAAGGTEGVDDIRCGPHALLPLVSRFLSSVSTPSSPSLCLPSIRVCVDVRADRYRCAHEVGSSHRCTMHGAVSSSRG